MSKVTLVWLVGLLVVSGGCVLYEEPMPAEQIEGLCGGMCGPCGLGSFDCEHEQCVKPEGWGSALDGVEDCSDVIFVSEEHEGEEDGSKEAPMTSLQAAVELAREEGASLVAMDDGVWREEVVVEGVSLVALEGRPSVVAEGSGEHATGVTVKGGDDLTISGLDVEASGAITNYGMRVLDGDVRLVDVSIQAGKGKDGEDGDDGAGGGSGTRGEDGGWQERWRGGRRGENAECSAANGGDGGRGRVGGNEASQGEGSTGGAVGTWGSGENGWDGAPGDDGRPGEGSELIDGLWERGGEGEQGESGEPGVGGAGGGGGGAGDSEGVGGGGGAGGAGGCGGQGGEGGESGGSSIGLLVWKGNVELVNSEVESEEGGDGGRGGRGGLGGEGRGGGSGASGDGSGDSGSDGGRGGDGGPGGKGGYGRGGQSYAVVCGDDATLKVSKSQLVHASGGREGPDLAMHAESGLEFNCHLDGGKL